MASGPQHYRDAERAADASVYAYQKWGESGNPGDLKAAKWEQGQAQVHATLALVALQADPWGNEAGWKEVLR